MNYEDVCYINVERWSGAEHSEGEKASNDWWLFLSSPSGHAEEHTSGSPGPSAPADGPDWTGDSGWEAQWKEERSRPALRDPSHRKGHERTLPQQGPHVSAPNQKSTDRWSLCFWLMSDFFFSICCGISLCPSVGGHQTLELLSWLNTLFLVHGLAERLHKNTSFPQGIIIRLSSATHSGICAQACLQDGLDGAGCEFPAAWIFSESLHYCYPKWEDARVKWAINAKWNTSTLSLCLVCIHSLSWLHRALM